jgi:alkylation response protein AidB-like acyl-CoA dehydrogenase
MNFDLSEEQLLLSDAVARMFEGHARDGADAAAVWRDYRDLGLLDLPFAADLGGHEAVMLVMEAYGRTLGTAPYLQSVLLAGRVLALAGSDTLGGLLDGGMRPALCLYEPGSRYRWDAPATRVEGGQLSGKKVSVLNGAADLLIVPAATPAGLGLFLVEASAAGVSIVSRPTPDGRIAADIVFSDVEAVAIGAPDRTAAILSEAIDGAIAALCAEAVGAMEQLLAITVEYLKTRKQFGAPIGSFQALQHRAADMLVAIEQARSMTFHAVSMMDAEPEARHVAVCAAKALVNRSARFVGTQAVQLHGGMGLASEYPAGGYFQRLTVIEGLLGDSDWLLAEVEKGGGLI